MSETADPVTENDYNNHLESDIYDSEVSKTWRSKEDENDNQAALTPVGPSDLPAHTCTQLPKDHLIKSYFVWSVINTVLCCLPLGVAALVFSRRTKKSVLKGWFCYALQDYRCQP